MAFRRGAGPEPTRGPVDLGQDLAGIGMRFVTAPNWQADIERTLVLASVEGMERSSLRVLSVLVTWLTVHWRSVIPGRIQRAVEERNLVRTQVFWASIGRGLLRLDHRFSPLARMAVPAERLDLSGDRTEFHVRRHGEDDLFAGSALCVPANVLRRRSADVLSPEELGRYHRAYAWRLAFGPSVRADLWAALEGDPSLAPASLARLVDSGFATASRTRRDFRVWKSAEDWRRQVEQTG